MKNEEWDIFSRKVLEVLPEDAKKNQWEKYPELFNQRLQDALTRGVETVDEWVMFFDSMFSYKIDPLQVTIGIKPPYPCTSILVPTQDMGVQMYKRRNPNTTCSDPRESLLAQVYLKGLDIFPYGRYTPKPLGFDFFLDVKDCSKRPKRPYLIWVKIPEFNLKEKSKIYWDKHNDNPGTTLLEQMLLDLFWWDKYQLPFGINRGDKWKNNYDYSTSVMCNGSEIEEGSKTYLKYNDSHYDKYKRIIPGTYWGKGGYYITCDGYDNSIISDELCFVTF
jgi:hypothetical protein